MEEEQQFRRVSGEASYHAHSFSSNQPSREASYRAPSFSSNQQPTPPLRIQTSTGSVPRLAHGSQTNLSITPLSLRPRTDTTRSADTVSPTSRSSLDMGFRIRSRDPPDPASRAASIRAARLAFTEKEAAKARKAEEEELKAANRQIRKREKREDGHRRKSSVKEEDGARFNAINEKTLAVPGREHSDLTPVPSHQIPPPEPVDGPGPVRANTQSSAKHVAKGRWVGFWIWLRTRVFKLGKKVGTAT